MFCYPRARDADTQPQHEYNEVHYFTLHSPANFNYNKKNYKQRYNKGKDMF